MKTVSDLLLQAKFLHQIFLFISIVYFRMCQVSSPLFIRTSLSFARALFRSINLQNMKMIVHMIISILDGYDLAT